MKVLINFVQCFSLLIDINKKLNKLTDNYKFISNLYIKDLEIDYEIQLFYLLFNVVISNIAYKYKHSYLFKYSYLLHK